MPVPAVIGFKIGIPDAVANVDELAVVIAPLVLPPTAYVLSNVTAPVTLIAPVGTIAPPAEITFKCVADVPVAVMPANVIVCILPKVLSKVSVAAVPELLVKLKVPVWVMLPLALISTLVPALIAACKSAVDTVTALALAKAELKVPPVEPPITPVAMVTLVGSNNHSFSALTLRLDVVNCSPEVSTLKPLKVESLTLAALVNAPIPKPSRPIAMSCAAIVEFFTLTALLACKINASCARNVLASTFVVFSEVIESCVPAVMCD